MIYDIPLATSLLILPTQLKQRGATMHVLLIDDHPLYRQALGSHLVALAEVVQVIEASSCAQALTQLKPEQEIDLILLDIVLAGENGLDQMGELRKRCPAAPVVVISASENAAQVRLAIARGAAGYIPKSANADVIRAALQIVMNGGTYVPAFTIMQTLTQTDAAAMASNAVLTARQLQILASLAMGRSNKRIATELGVAEATVRAHVTQILKTLRVSNRTEAGYAATQRGLLKPGK